MKELTLNTVDLIVFGVYFILIILISIKFRQRSARLEDNFTGGRSFSWAIIGLAIFSANIGSEHCVGLPENGFVNGFGKSNTEIMAIIPITVLGWIVAPYLIKRDISTLPEYVELRYGKLAKWIIIGMSFLAYVTVKISISLFAGAYLLKELLGMDYYSASLLLLVITGVYTLIGGIRAVMVNGAVQTAIILMSGAVLTYFALDSAGGLDQVIADAGPGAFKIFHLEGQSTMSVVTYTFASFFSGIWYWCSDQYMVQRAVGGKSIGHVVKGTALTSFLKLLLLFIFIFPGIIAAIEFPGIKPSDAFSTLIVSHVPEGFRGFVIIGVLAALMSSLASTFTTISAVFTLDFYKKKYPQSSDFKLMNIGRIAVLAFMIFAIVWIPIVPVLSDHVFEYLRVLQFQLGIPVSIIIVIGMIWRKPGQKAVLAVLGFGFIAGLFKSILIITGAGAEETSLFHFFSSVDKYDYYAVVILLCILILVVMSFIFPASSQKLALLDQRQFYYQVADDKKQMRQGLILTLLVNALLIGTWIVLG